VQCLSSYFRNHINEFMVGKRMLVIIDIAHLAQKTNMRSDNYIHHAHAWWLTTMKCYSPCALSLSIIIASDQRSDTKSTIDKVRSRMRMRTVDNIFGLIRHHARLHTDNIFSKCLYSWTTAGTGTGFSATGKPSLRIYIKVLVPCSVIFALQLCRLWI